jgi:competence protein ComGF
MKLNKAPTHQSAITVAEWKAMTPDERAIIEASEPFKKMQKEYVEQHQERLSQISKAQSEIATAFQQLQDFQTVAVTRMQSEFQRLHDQWQQTMEPISSSIRWSIDAVLLHHAIQEGDDSTANELMSSKDFCLPVVKMLVAFSQMDVERQTGRMKEMLADLQSELDEIERKKSDKTKRASATRRENSQIPEIKEWFARKEKSGCKINHRDVSGEAAEFFGVSGAYIRKIRQQYLAEKAPK